MVYSRALIFAVRHWNLPLVSQAATKKCIHGKFE